LGNVGSFNVQQLAYFASPAQQTITITSGYAYQVFRQAAETIKMGYALFVTQAIT
jgi:hypothetical protein